MLRALGQLAARELGLARGETGAALAPRLPSRYEAVDAGAHANGIDATTDVATPNETRTAPSVSDIATFATDRSAVVIPASVHRDAGESIAPEQPARIEAHAAFDPHAVVDSARPHANASDTIAPAFVAPTTTTLQHSVVVPHDDTRVPRKAIHDEPRVSSPVHPVEHATAAHPQASKPSAALPREASALRPVPLPPPIARAPSKPTTSAPVQITIGRIEIRASKDSAAPAATPSRSTASPSLSTYLRRRSEGGRS